ncbi:hypothetical protein HDV64DRAFT_115119 [Trichoderma sp. TUCIM 5745]
MFSLNMKPTICRKGVVRFAKVVTLAILNLWQLLALYIGICHLVGYPSSEIEACVVSRSCPYIWSHPRHPW